MTDTSSHALTKLSDLQKDLNGSLDLLICSASFETRCLSVPMSLDSGKVGSVLILKNEDVLGNGADHADAIGNHFHGKARQVDISKINPVITADRIIFGLRSIVEFYEKEFSKGRLLVDISTFTHETLLILFKILNNLSTDHFNISYVYTNAMEYDPGSSDDVKWLSQGVSDIRSVLGYPGDMRPSRKSHLIVLVGYEDERAGKLIEMYEPTILSLGIGDVVPVSEQLYKINKTYYRKLMEMRPGAQEFSFSPTDAFAVRDIILEQADKFEGYNIIVAPMNTKISTLGVALAAIKNPDIQICYGRAVQYNVDNYSKPAEDCRLFSLDD